MTRIEKYGIFCRSYEGGWANDPSDAGGMTMQGVTMATYKAYRKRKGLPTPTAKDLRNITANEWNEILYDGYWSKIQADHINCEWVAYLLADCVWMSGVGYIKKVQRTLGLTADGVVGPKTLAALNSGYASTMFKKLWLQRQANLKYIATLRNNSKYLKGWLRRLNGIKFGKLITNTGEELR